MRSLLIPRFALLVLLGGNMGHCIGSLAEARQGPAVPQKALAFVRAEQQENDINLISKAYVSPAITNIPAEYLPQGGNVFQVPFIPIPLQDLEWLGEKSTADFLTEGNTFRFLVHPASLSLYATLIQKYGLVYADYWATPTSSARSVVMWQEKAPQSVFSVKLSVAGERSGQTREVTPQEALHSVLVTKLLSNDNSPQNVEAETRLGLISEPFAAIPKSIAAGLIIKRIDNLDLQMRPVFSLYSKSSGASQSHIEKIAKREGRSVESVARSFAIALQDSLVSFYRRTGVIPEPHSQNVLYRYRRGQWKFRFRDASGAAVNYSIRQQLGLNSEPLFEFRERYKAAFDEPYEVTRGETYFFKAMTLHFFRGTIEPLSRTLNSGQMEFLNSIASSIDKALTEDEGLKRSRPFFRMNANLGTRERSCQALFNSK